MRWAGLDAEGFRLPTEAEWEYACRAGAVEDEAAAAAELKRLELAHGYHHRHHARIPNAWGLARMMRRAQELCWDEYVADPPTAPDGTATDPTGPLTRQVNADAVVKGGGFGWEPSCSPSVATRRWGGGHSFRIVGSLP